MSEQKPNHICKNVNCKKGIDGKPKEYWACNDCDKSHSYREVACSPKCFQEYMEQVFASRNEVVQAEEIKEKTESVTMIESAIVDDKVMTTKKNNCRTKISEEA